MSRFAGIKNNNIFIVSDTSFTHETYQVIEIPPELDNVSLKDLISDYKFKNNKIVLKRERKPANELKIAFVSNHQMRCGLSTYGSFLFPEIIKHIYDYKLFVEYNEFPTGPINEIGNLKIKDDKIVACWKRGDSNKDLVKNLKEYDPDIILINHEFGLFPNACHWISMMNQLSEYRVIVIMHSVFHHKDKTIVEAAIPEIIVHLEGAKTLLKNEKGIPGEVYVIPHGSFPCIDKNKLWNFYKTEHTFVQFGYGFRYKSWQYAIQAIAILKVKYPDVFFTGLFSESPYNKSEHQLYYNELMELVSELGVEENVGIIRGYQSDASLDSYLRTNQVAVFPYTSNPAHEVFGASGAARMAMSKGIVVITSSVNHFSDLQSIKADTPEQIAFELDKLFSDYKLKNIQIEKQNEYLENTSWEKVAQKYISVFEK